MEMPVTEAKIQEIVDKIALEFKPEKIILFGSYAWGKPTEDSDVDLFVIKDSADTRELDQEIDGAFFPRHFAMDVLVYTPEAVRVRYEQGHTFITDILNNGKILYDRTHH